jgi:mannose-6-phosphate isomerase
MSLPPFLRLHPEYHPRVWGGQRLQPTAATPIGEAWIVYEHNQIADGPLAGQTLAAVTAQYGEALLGRRGAQPAGGRFPLLIKLLDCTAWLSLQVHPNDKQAARLEGPGQLGKTEAWHILEADAGAKVIAGLQPGVTADTLAHALQAGTILDCVQYLPVQAGDTIFMRAGTIHALGPGLLLYEVQQTSDITYRVFDWNRPAAAGRELHVEKSLAVANPQAVGQARPRPVLGDGDHQPLVACPQFTLELLGGHTRPVSGDPRGESFHTLTVITGRARVTAPGWSQSLNRFETLILPASSAAYIMEPEEEFQALRASVEKPA